MGCLAARARLLVDGRRVRDDPVHVDVEEPQRPGPKLRGSIGEGSNHSNFSHQSSVKILSKFNTKFRIFQHFRKYLRKSDKLSSNSEQNSMIFFSKMGKFWNILPKNAKKFDDSFLKY